MLKEFKEFLVHRNVIDLSIGVIVGSALTTFVRSLVDHLINPLIGLIFNQEMLANLSFRLGSANFMYGAFLNDFISFILTCFIVFLLIKAINKTFRLQKEEAPAINEELATLQEIRDLLAKQKADQARQVRQARKRR